MVAYEKYEEDGGSEIAVHEIRDGLFCIVWKLDHSQILNKIKGVFQTRIHLCGSHSNLSYTFSYSNESYTDQNGGQTGYIFTVKELLSADLSFYNGSKKQAVSPGLFYEEKKERKGKKGKDGDEEDEVCNSYIFSEDLESIIPRPNHVWFDIHGNVDIEYRPRQLDQNLPLSLVEINPRKWEKEVKCHKYHWKPSKFIVWMDFGTSTTRGKNLIKMTTRRMELFSNQNLCDVQFDFKDVGSTQTIGAHVFILATGSTVFSTMFQSEFLEAKTKNVEITDIEIEVFQQLLIHLYTGNAPKLAEENITQKLFVAADKYNIEALKAECTYVLLNRINLGNAINLLVWSHLHSDDLLKETLKFLAVNSLKICFQPRWTDLNKLYPELFVLVTQHMSTLANKTLKFSYKLNSHEFLMSDSDSEISAKEIRNGLYRVEWFLGNNQFYMGVFKKKIYLGGHSKKFYTLKYDNGRYENRYVFTVQELSSTDLYFHNDSGKYPTDVSHRLFRDDEEQPQMKRKKLSEREPTILSEDLESEIACPIYMWFDTHHYGGFGDDEDGDDDSDDDEYTELLQISLLKINSKKWRKEVKYPKNPFEGTCRFTVWIDFGTSTTQEKNLIKMTTRLMDLFYNQNLCDVQFEFKDVGKTIGAHAVILAAGSTVFSAVLQTEFLEVKNNNVTITDIEIEVFRQLLIHLYTGNAPKLAEENMTQKLFVAADKYDIETLKAECTSALLKRINLDNAINLFVWSKVNSVSELLEKTLKFLAINSLKICSQPEWMELNKLYPDLGILAMKHMSKLANKTLVFRCRFDN